jgi:predicted transcriptional regulator
MSVNEKYRLDERRVRVILSLSRDSDSSIPQLMFHTFLCYETLNKYLDVLAEKGLISSCKDNKRRFFTTEQGVEFLKRARSNFHLDLIATQNEKQRISLVTA